MNAPDAVARRAGAEPPVGAEPLVARQLAVDLAGRRVLHDVGVAFAGGWTAVVGPNGAGKSTLLRALAGLLVPAQGEVRLGRRPLGELGPRERAQRIAWLAQTTTPSGELTVRETVQLGRFAALGLWARPGPADEAAVDAAMQATACAAWSARPLQALSGGERQRVLLARALATGASTLLLDEPTTHLDPPHQVALAGLLQRLGRRQTVVSVLHDLPLALHADRLLLLDRGRLLAAGAPQDPALHAAIEQAFGHAIRIVAHQGQPLVQPCLPHPGRPPEPEGAMP